MEYKETQSHEEKRSTGMAVAALVLGICGTVTGLCPYTGFILGSLAIIFGLLSRGGEMTMNGQAKAGVILGSIGIGLSCIVFIIAIAQGAFNNIRYELEYPNYRIHHNYNYDYDYDHDYDHHFDDYHDYDFDDYDFDDYDFDFDDTF